MMGAVTFRRARAAVTGLAEIVASFAEPGGRPGCRVTGIETMRAGRDVEGRPMTEHPGRRVGILDDENQALGALRYPRPR